jgi:hypothetical protein
MNFVASQANNCAERSPGEVPLSATAARINLKSSPLSSPQILPDLIEDGLQKGGYQLLGAVVADMIVVDVESTPRVRLDGVSIAIKPIVPRTDHS